MHSRTSKYTLLSVILVKSKMFEVSEVFSIEIEKHHRVKQGGRGRGVSHKGQETRTGVVRLKSTL